MSSPTTHFSIPLSEYQDSQTKEHALNEYPPAPPSADSGDNTSDDSIFVRSAPPAPGPLSTLSQDEARHTQQSNPSKAHTQTQDDVHTAPFTQESLLEGSQGSLSQEPIILSSSTPPGSVSAPPPCIEIHSRNQAVIRLVCSRPNHENRHPLDDPKWLEQRTRSQVRARSMKTPSFATRFAPRLRT